MNNDLKPCPLCGCPIKHGMAKRGRCQLHGEPIIGHRVWCESCGMSVEYGSYELAKKFWNTRAPVRVKLPRRYEDTDGYLCLSYTGTVASLKRQGVEVEP